MGGWVVNATPRPLYPREWSCTHCIGGWVGPVSTGAENLAPTGIRSPDRPARSESLYRLSYRGPPSSFLPMNYLKIPSQSYIIGGSDKPYTNLPINQSYTTWTNIQRAELGYSGHMIMHHTSGCTTQCKSVPRSWDVPDACIKRLLSGSYYSQVPFK